jgi:F-type H+-transporting ATPase subunit epsilon
METREQTPMAFQCVIVTPEHQVLDEQVTQAVLPAHDGQIGILTDRAPLLVKLGVGPLRLDLASGGGRQQTMFVDGGIAQMKDNRLTILTNEALPPDQLNAETARAEYAEAVARRITDQKSYDDRDHAIRRARAKQELAAAR